MTGSKGETGYYGFYAEHNPSSSINVSESQIKFSENNYSESEVLCSVVNSQAKSFEPQCPQLNVYEGGKIIYEY